jgi:hypothetical protein
MKAEKEAQEMISRRRAEEAQRQQILQRMGNGTPGQPHVRSRLRSTRRLMSAVLRLRPKSHSLKRKDKGRGSPHNNQLRTMVLQGPRSTDRQCPKYAHRSTFRSNSESQQPMLLAYLPSRSCKYRQPSSGSWQRRMPTLLLLAQISTRHICPQVLLNERHYHPLFCLILLRREHRPRRILLAHHQPHSTQDTPSLRRI